MCDTFTYVVLNKKTREKFRVTPGKKFRLKDVDPGWRGDGELNELKASAAKVLGENLQDLAAQQAKLYAHDRWSVLIVLQAMDAAGKDGMVNFLWRIMRVSPARGKITIFNRSHYEEVLVVKVHPEYLQKQKLPASLVTKKIWEERYEDINNFERLEEPDKHWKFSLQDLNERHGM